ncbi:MAG: prolyl oligopeptidase family serine peptidase [Luteitalea sp.]|nr:prolyl oligopeptidase family serine peptidase [Luteitalea sp.]
MQRRRMLQTMSAGAVALFGQLPGRADQVDPRTGAQLVRKRYESKATGAPREYFLYLPVGYQSETAKKWPVILFLHGGGERGDGLEELKYTLRYGPLMEAWTQGRDLPFIIINPQMPMFEPPQHERPPLPERSPEGAAPPRDYGNRPSQPMAREAANEEPPPQSPRYPPWMRWETLEDEVLAMVDNTLADYRADTGRVYLTGLSYGGYGTWFLGTRHPKRWAAIAPICGDGDPKLVDRLVAQELPLWIFHGGRDTVVQPWRSLEMAVALEAAGHPDVRLTVHEDLGHNVWTRVYEGQDLYSWFLKHRRE